MDINGDLDVNGTGTITQTGTNVVTMTGGTKTIDVEATATTTTLELTVGGTIANTSNITLEDISVSKRKNVNLSDFYIGNLK